MAGDPEAPHLPLPWWRRALPFVLGAGLVAFVLSRIDLGAFARALGRTHHLGFIAFTLAFNFALLGADSLATSWVYRRRVCAVGFRDFFLVRAASYLPALVNHHLGQGWVTWYMARRHGAPLERVASATLFVYATTFAGVVLLGVAAWPLAGDQLPWLGPVVGALLVAGAAYLAVVAWAPRVLRERPVTSVLMEEGLRGHLLGVLVRMPHVLVQFVGAWLPFWFFDVPVPLGAALAYCPVLMLVVTLPLTPVGVGTRDVLALQFFAGYGRGTPEESAAAVAAATVSWAAALTLVQLGTSPLFMRLVTRAPAAPVGP